MAFDGTSGGCWTPTWPVRIDREPRMKIAKFGDGYEQRVLDGLNPMQTSWNLQWDMRPRDDALAIDLYLTAQQGGAFDFLDPHTDSIVQVFCDKWSIDWVLKGNKGDYANIAAEFRNANGFALGPLV
jgi:phage-related protein